MMDNHSPEISNSKYKKQWRSTAVSVAAVAAIFSIIIASVIVVIFLKAYLLEPLRSERLETMKTQLRQTPSDEALLSEIRSLDKKIRQAQLDYWKYMNRSTILLIAGLAVFVAAVKISAALKDSPPQLDEQTHQQKNQLINFTLTRWSITLAAFIAASGALYFASAPIINFSNSTAPAFPSWQQWNQNWPAFRGPQGNGISTSENIPIFWDEATGENIIWKSAVPLSGYSSPVLWNDRIFLSGADEKQRQVYCYDAGSGKLLWTGNVTPQKDYTDKINVMEDTGYAAPTMVTDGQRAYAVFASGDIAAFDYKGEKVWEKSLQIPDSAYGYASSLAMFQDKVIIQFDQSMPDAGKSSLIALDSMTGVKVYETPRPVANSWASPVVVKIDQDNFQLLTLAEPFAISHRPSNGAEIWRLECLGADVAASPIYTGDYVIALSPYDKLSAINPNATGNLTDKNIAWQTYEGLPDICSPLSDGKHIWLLQTYGLLTCLNAEDGSVVYSKQLDYQFNASPSLVKQLIYLVSLDGKTIIINNGPEYRQVSECFLQEGAFATPAFMQGRIFIRTKNNLYCLGKKQ